LFSKNIFRLINPLSDNQFYFATLIQVYKLIKTSVIASLSRHRSIFVTQSTV